MHDRIAKPARGLLVRAMQILPLAAIVLAVSYYTARQIASPNQRMIKMGVLGSMLVFMFRFDIIYSVFAFTLLFPFPSAITLGSTNSVMMTLITLAWAIRATSTGQRLARPTPYDHTFAVLVLAYVLSFYNVPDNHMMVLGLRVFWKQLAAIMYFYAVIMFVDSTERLIRFTKVAGVMISIVVFTGIIELFAPGSTIVPGWLTLQQRHVVPGSLTYRIEGVRLGGVVGGHNILGDMASIGLFIMIFHALRSRNPLERVSWSAAALMSLTVLMGTANRGAFISLVLALLYGLFWFRTRISFAKFVIACSVIIAVFVTTQLVLDRFTYAVSMTDRLLHTKMEGLTPDTRVGVWKPAFMKSLEHPFIGHGPEYDTGYGLTFRYWPHNAYIYYFYTIGLVGAGAFLVLCGLLVKRSLAFRRPGVWGTPVGDLATIFHVELLMLLFGQLRTDHQRDEVHIYVIYLVFALVAATASVIDRRGRSPAEIAESDLAS